MNPVDSQGKLAGLSFFQKNKKQYKIFIIRILCKKCLTLSGCLNCDPFQLPVKIYGIRIRHPRYIIDHIPGTPVTGCGNIIHVKMNIGDQPYRIQRFTGTFFSIRRLIFHGSHKNLHQPGQHFKTCGLDLQHALRIIDMPEREPRNFIRMFCRRNKIR